MCSASENKSNGTEESETSDDEHMFEFWKVLGYKIYSIANTCFSL